MSAVRNLHDLSHPSAVIARLEEIERDLATRQNEYERAAMEWFKKKRDQEHDRAVAFIVATGPVAERQAIAARDTSHIGRDEEAAYESLKAVVRTLETRASIGQSILRSQGRA